VTTDGTRVFWAIEGSVSGGEILSTVISGNDPIMTLASGQPGPASVAVDQTSVFWTNFAGSGFIRSANKLDGTGVKDLAPSSTSWSLVIDSTDVFWTNLQGSVKRIAKSGGASATAIPGESIPWDVSLSESEVFWTARQGGTIRKVAKALSGTPVSIVSGLVNPLGLFIHHDRVYWVEAVDFTGSECPTAVGKVSSANLTGGDLKVHAQNQACPTRIFAEGTDVYWTNAGTVSGGIYNYDGAVMHMKEDGTGVETVAVGQVKPHGITATSTTLFWTAQGAQAGEGAVLKLAR
jgi:hypothetical protein